MIDLNTIPRHWEKVSIREISKKNKYSIVDGPFGTQLKVHEFVAQGIPLVEMQNITADKFIPHFRRFLTDEKYEEVKRSEAVPGDIILSKTGSLGYVAIIPKEINKAIITSRLAKISVDWSKIKADFLLSYLIYLRNNGFWEKIAKGTTMKVLNIKQIAETIIPLPPLPEQQLITEKIEKLFNELELGRRQLETVKEKLRLYRQAVLKFAFEGKLLNKDRNNNIPQKGWSWKRLGELVNSVEYGSGAKSEEIGKIPVLRMGNIQNGRFEWSDLVYTNDDDEISKYLLHHNDVLFNRTNSPELVGKTAIYKSEKAAIFAGYLIRINVKEELLNHDYLAYFLNSPFAKNYGSTVKTDGVNQSNINGQKLKSYPIPYCDLQQQQLVVEEIEKRFLASKMLLVTIEQELSQIEALKQSILKKAFEGKLVKTQTN